VARFDGQLPIMAACHHYIESQLVTL